MFGTHSGHRRESKYVEIHHNKGYDETRPTPSVLPQVLSGNSRSKTQTDVISKSCSAFRENRAGSTFYPTRPLLQKTSYPHRVPKIL